MSVGELIDQDEDIDVPAAPQTAMAMVTTRQAQEVQAAMFVARKFPRSEERAIARITQACKRQLLAECSQYEYQRGGTVITGPSIRLAEVLAQNWGNIDFGIVELERKAGESIAMSYCWDLETNVRQTKVFTVRHVRDTRGGQKALRDERDIYEHIANYGARRLRACVLGIIPGDVQQLAMEECDKTIAGKNTEPRADRVRKMVVAFAEIGVSAEMIEAKLCHKCEAITDRQLISLRKIYTAIKDGVATPADHFKLPQSGDSVEQGESIDDLKAQVSGKTEQPKKPADEWSIFTQMVAITKTVNDVKTARKYGAEKFPNRQDEVMKLCDDTEADIRSGDKGGGKKKDKLFDTQPDQHSGQ